jgi:hypothetical protein
MSNQFDLSLHDIRLADSTTFGVGGKVIPQKRLTFFVGDHGPFNIVYAPAQATTARIKSDIDAQVQQLRELSTLGQ